MKTYVSIIPQYKYLGTHPAVQVYQEHVSSLFLLSPDLSFFMEAKEGLAVLRILIPRDLAALDYFSF